MTSLAASDRLQNVIKHCTKGARNGSGRTKSRLIRQERRGVSPTPPYGGLLVELFSWLQKRVSPHVSASPSDPNTMIITQF